MPSLVSRSLSGMLAALLMLLTLVIPLASCGGEEGPPPTARAVLTAMETVMVRTAQPLPDGVVYSRAAAPDSPDYLGEVFFTALYGRAAEGLLSGADSPDSAAVGDAAMFLSMAPYPCELAVFRCAGVDAVPTLVTLCRERLDVVARGFQGTRWESAAHGLVASEGCYVLLAITEDPRAVIEGAREAIRRRG